MNAEIVRADEIKAGDRIRHRGYTIEVCESYPLVMQDTGRQKQAIRYRNSNGEYFTTWRTDPGTEVARILPDPLEVREFWRAVHEDLDGERFGEECETRDEAIDDGANLRVDQFEIEHVRETILSREEVKP